MLTVHGFKATCAIPQPKGTKPTQYYMLRHIHMGIVTVENTLALAALIHTIHVQIHVYMYISMSAKIIMHLSPQGTNN